MKSEGYCEITSKTGKGEKKERKKERIASKYDVKIYQILLVPNRHLRPKFTTFLFSEAKAIAVMAKARRPAGGPEEFKRNDSEPWK